jgi:hypothetical protein
LQGLYRKELLEKANGGQRFAVELFRRWILKNPVVVTDPPCQPQASADPPGSAAVTCTKNTIGRGAEAVSHGAGEGTRCGAGWLCSRTDAVRGISGRPAPLRIVAPQRVDALLDRRVAHE